MSRAGEPEDTGKIVTLGGQPPSLDMLAEQIKHLEARAATTDKELKDARKRFLKELTARNLGIENWNADDMK